MKPYDFGGWATKNNLRCSDGRVIIKDAFKHQDGQTVPLVWNHQHDDPSNVIGHALLRNKEDGVYAYCYFNNTAKGQDSKELVRHGDIFSLSIYANKLRQEGSNVMHGMIRELSMVLAGANPGAFIDAVLCHGENSEEEAIIYTGEGIELYHADEDQNKTESEKENVKMENETKKPAEGEQEKTIQDVYNEMTEEQKTCVHALVGAALEQQEADDEEDEEETTMKHNVFDKNDSREQNVLCHADEKAIFDLAKTSSVGSLQQAMSIYAEDHEELQHAFSEGDTAKLFPDFKEVYSGAPEPLERDMGWVGVVMKKTRKSPISRVRTTQIDARAADIRAKGYNNRKDAKSISAAMKVLNRTTDPQTVYRKDEMHRDDLVDITSFDAAAYQYNVMRHNLEEDIAMAAMISDGRDDGDADKIHEDHIRSIMNDDELYTIHAEVDIEAMRQELQGTDTAKHFGDNYIYSEAVVTARTDASVKFKGTGTPDLYCAPSLLNKMMLARDMNGRRMYDSKADLAAALNVNDIYTAEQFEGVTCANGNKLLGIIVNMADYQFGSTKGGEITRFQQFDIDFNKEKYLIETRLSGALTRVYSAIVLEEPVEVEN